MRPYLVSLFIITLITSCNNTPEPSNLETIPYQEKVALVPQVQNLSLASARFVMNKETVLIIEPQYEKEGQYLKELLEASMGFDLKTATTATQNFIRLEALKSKKTLPAETYHLQIDS
ncbi:MAG: hypothetical protein ACI976_002374, partial [Aureispira sp.]